MKLGQKILKELGQAETNKTLTRWMAHRIAELLERAEQDSDEKQREATRRECSDLVLRIWAQRNDWPDRASLSRILSLIEKAFPEPRPYRRFQPEQPPSTWLDGLSDFDTLQDEAERVWWEAIIFQVDHQDVADELERASAFGDDLSEDELKVVQFLQQAKELVEHHPEIAVMSAEAQAEHFRQKLAAVQEKQANLFAGVTSTIVRWGDSSSDDEPEESASDDEDD